MPDMCDGFESLNIVGNVPRAVEFGNAANQMSDDTSKPNKAMVVE